MHDFDEKLAEGKHFEGILDRFFSDEFIIQQATIKMERDGIDRTFIYRNGLGQFGVQYKADSAAARTNNIFIELVSNDVIRSPGWAVHPMPPVMVFFIPPLLKLCWVHEARLRAVVPDWSKRFPHKFAENAGYKTEGVVVPMAVFRTIVEYTFFVPPDGDLEGDADSRIEVKGKNGWEVKQWARGLGTFLSWRSALARLEIAQRLSPHQRYRIVGGE